MKDRQYGNQCTNEKCEESFAHMKDFLYFCSPKKVEWGFEN